MTDESTEEKAKAWFDQFPPLAEGATWSNPQWCPRHWAPCPTLGANGIGAFTEVTQIWLEELKPPDLRPTDVAALNAALAADSPVCCKLGDVRMYEVWGHWPPVEGVPAPDWPHLGAPPDTQGEPGVPQG